MPPRDWLGGPERQVQPGWRMKIPASLLLCPRENFTVVLGPVQLFKSPSPWSNGGSPMSRLFLSWIVQGPQLPSELDISWTERGLRVQERGNSPQDRSSSPGKQKQRASCTEFLAFLPVLFSGRQVSQPSSHFLPWHRHFYLMSGSGQWSGPWLF